MEQTANNSFIYLPDEIKLKIFAYLDSVDIIQLANVCQAFLNISFDKKLVHYLNLFREYRFNKSHISSFILKSPRKETITTLNITSTYWIPGKDLRRCISRLPSLECLYAIDTKLGLSAKDSRLYKSIVNIRKLGVTFRHKEIDTESVNLFPDLKGLFLHIYSLPKNDILLLRMLIEKLKNLNELWVINIYACDIRMIMPHVLSGKIKKVTLQFFTGTCVVNVMNYDVGGIVFKNRRDSHQISFEHFDTTVNNIYKLWHSEAALWDVLVNQCKYDLPFCQVDAKKLIFGHCSLTDIQFQELNLSHINVVCSERLVNTLTDILLTEQSKSLKKLSVNFCLCQSIIELQQKDMSSGEPLFKRTRMTVRISNNSLLLNVILNSPLIEELEIWECRRVEIISDIALTAISRLTHLRRLTLDGVSPHVNGQFLSTILESCKNLISLRMKTTKPNASLINYFCAALQKTNSLKDFRYESYNVPLDKILKAMIKAPNCKLERIFLKSKIIDKLSILPLETFLNNNEQLKFMCLVINGLPKACIKSIQNSMKKFADSSQKIFIAAGTDDIYTPRSCHLPHIYQHEMIEFKTNVSVLDIFNGFT